MYTLKELIDKAYNEMLDAGFSVKTVYASNWYIWNRLIRIHGPDEIFKETMIYEYCNEYFGRDIYKIDKSKLRKVEINYIRAYSNLINSSKDIPFTELNYHFRRDFALSEKSNQLFTDYLTQSKSDGNSSRTLLNKEEVIKRFLIEVDFDHLTKDDIIAYLTRRKSEIGKTAYVIDMRLIRRFLVFCFERKVITKEVLNAWPSKMSSTADKEIPSVYTSDEIMKLLESAKEYKSEDNHLRNYAILCLIAYSGIRANDVVHLKLNNIDWRSNIIRIIQQKTKREHVIPLIPEIGNPIINYLRYERNSKSEYVFTTEKGTKISSAIVTAIINIYFSNAPFDLKGRHYGAHALRHSLATNLINISTPVFSVANVLGHSSVESVHIYAKVDLNSLRKCIVEVPYRA